MERYNIKSECKFIEFKNNRLNYKCKECGKRCFKSIKGLIKKFSIVYQFCKGDINSVYRLFFKETSLPDKKAFYSELNKEGITDENHPHAQKVWKVFEIKDIGGYHDLYV